MALTLVLNPQNGLTPSINTAGLTFNNDRKVTVNPAGTITIYDASNTVLGTILGSDPEISVREG